MSLKAIYFELAITLALCYNISILGKDGYKMYYKITFTTVDENDELKSVVIFYLETFNEAVEFINRLYETVRKDSKVYRASIERIGD